MAAPTKQADIVVIHETYGTPANANKAHNHDTRLSYDVDGNLTKVEEIMLDGATEYLRKEATLAYDIDGNLETVTEKIFERDGATIEIQHTDTLAYGVGGNLDEIARAVV